MSQKISVALCTYNGETFIAKQLESIFNQTLAVNEIIICDDCSTDNTEKIIAKFISQHSNIIRFYKNKINLRSVKNFEQALGLCTGDYIFLSDQDDIWEQNKVQKIVTHFQENPKIECVFTDANFINDKDEIIKNYSLLDSCIFNPEMVKNCGGFWKVFQQYDNMVTGATMCIKKNIKDFIFPFPISFEFHHDEWMALHCAQRNSLSVLKDKLTNYRIHQNQQVGGNIIERTNNEIEYRKLTLSMKEPNEFKFYYRTFIRYYTLYRKFYSLQQQTESKTIDIDSLVIATRQNALLMKKKIITKYPLRGWFKFYKDKKRNKRQIL